jgi:hypothetical protein
MEHEGAVLTGTGGGGLTHLLHLVAAALGSSQQSRRWREAASRVERSRARVRGRWGREGDGPTRAWEVGKGRGALMG